MRWVVSYPRRLVYYYTIHLIIVGNSLVAELATILITGKNRTQYTGYEELTIINLGNEMNKKS